ncbi:MAG: FlgD immunoglobulin-like domain containing protein, partial [Acidimicrobiia bacterium]
FYNMFYTGVDEHGDQRIGLATSTDLTTWEQDSLPIFKVEQVPWADSLVTGPTYNGKQQFRDPFVIKDPDPMFPLRWLMFYVTVHKDFSPGMVVGVAKSDSGDFRQWSDLGPLINTRWGGQLQARVESPHVFPWRYNRWWLVHSIANGPGEGLLFQTSNLPANQNAGQWTVQTFLQLFSIGETSGMSYWKAAELIQFPERKYFAAWSDLVEGIVFRDVRPAPQSEPAESLAFAMACDLTSVEELLGERPEQRGTRLLLTGLRPARSSVGLRVEMPFRTRARLAVYDVLGRRVRTLLDGDLPAGATAVTWDGRDWKGVPVASGVYFTRLECRQSWCAVRVPLLR